jgi:hypothetical protein
MFDITSIAAADTSDIHLRGPDDELLFDENKKPITITVYGPGSRAYQQAQTLSQNRIMDRLKKKGRTDRSADDKLEEQANFLAACTVSFNGFAYPPAGKATGVELFRQAYADPTIGFIADQVNSHMGDWANFTKGSAKS